MQRPLMQLKVSLATYYVCRSNAYKADSPACERVLIEDPTLLLCVCSNQGIFDCSATWVNTISFQYETPYYR
jgi:hypothetical protein